MAKNDSKPNSEPAKEEAATFNSKIRFGAVKRVPRSEVYVSPGFNIRQNADGDLKTPEQVSAVESGKELTPSLGTTAALAEDIKAKGQLTPLLVTKIEDAPKNYIEEKNAKGCKYFLVAGFRRMGALKLLDAETVEIRVAEGTFEAADLLIENGNENLARQDVTTYDLACRFGQLSELGLSGEEIAVRMSSGGGKQYSKGYVNNLMRFKKQLHPEALLGWRNGSKWATKPNLDALAGMSMEEQKKKLGEIAKPAGNSGGTAPGTGTPRQQDAAKVKKPTPSNVKEALSDTLVEYGDSIQKSPEAYQLAGAVTVLRWMLGLRADGQKSFGKNKKLRVAGIDIWYVGKKREEEEDEDEDEDELEVG